MVKEEEMGAPEPIDLAEVRRRANEALEKESGISSTRRRGRLTEIGGLALLLAGGLIAVLAILAMAINFYGLVMAGVAAFGLLLMREGYRIFQS